MTIARRTGNGEARFTAGQAMVEYALILAAVASTLFLGMKLLGTKSQNTLSATTGAVTYDLGSGNTVGSTSDK